MGNLRSFRRRSRNAIKPTEAQMAPRRMFNANKGKRKNYAKERVWPRHA